MLQSPLIYFTDAVLRAPTIGSMLMCLTAALVGVIVFLRKQSLLGESLSHAAYPGVILGVIIAAYISKNGEETAWTASCVLGGAFLASLAGLWAIELLQRYANIRSDSALCFVLSAFFGVGLTFASRVQFTHSKLYRQIQMYLYGQTATMTDWHIALYGILALLVICVIALLYKELQVLNFDRDFARSIGIKVGIIETLFFILVVLAVVIGIRCVGVVLMSAMLIAPAAAARQYTHQLSAMLAIASFFGLLSGFLGNYLSVEFSYYLLEKYPDRWLALPTGPMIVIVSSAICFLSLLFAPERGLILRMLRVLQFRFKCLQENLLKAIWRIDPKAKVEVSVRDLQRYHMAWVVTIWLVLQRLVHAGWLTRTKKHRYKLSSDGKERAAYIVRLHRLWEVYLANYLGVGVERVHPNAEEMEHIITPELEKKLTELLDDPKQDPHSQPIPPQKGY